MGFNDLDDDNELGFGDIDQEPSAFGDFGDEEGLFDDFEAEETTGGGISRTFKILGAVLMIVVILIVVALILFALTSGDELSSNQKTSTAVIKTNTAVAVALVQTQDAINLALTASQEAIMTFEANSTATQISFETQQAQAAIDAANTATAEYQSNQTATSDALQAQAADLETQTAVATINTVTGKLVEDDTAYGGVTIRLYRDDGDGVFNPADLTPPPTQPGGGLPSGDTSAQAISIGQTVEGTLQSGVTAEWDFTGAAGDIITINAIAGDPVQMDTFLALIGPDGASLIEDDDGGERLDAAIVDYTLPTDGQYTIRVSSVSGPGPYTLSLTSAGAAVIEGTQEVIEPGMEPTLESATEPASDAVSYHAGGRANGAYDMLIQDTGGTTPSPQPTEPPSADEFITSITTNPDGTFNFGALEPDIYWLVVDYETLPPDLKARISPTEQVLLMINVPTAGEVTIDLAPFVAGGPTPNFVGSMTARAQTGTPPEAAGTEAATEEVVGVVTEEALPGTGLFSDVSDAASDVDSSNGLTVLIIAAVGLVAVVFIVRKLRTS